MRQRRPLSADPFAALAEMVRAKEVID